MAKEHYPAEFVTFLEMQWGPGFLSPGGREEVLEILKHVDVKGKRVLDIGCGTCGPAMVVAAERSPERVVGIDIESNLVDICKTNISNAGLTQLVEVQLVEAGPLTFPDNSFDIVFSKDSLIHVADKIGMYKDILRVLVPGGVFAASDWLRSADADALEGYNQWQALTTLSYEMQTCDEALDELNTAGFVDVKSIDRNNWYATIAAQDVEMMKSEEGQVKFIEVFGAKDYEQKLAVREANAEAAICGGLRPTHLYGTCPKL